MESDYESGVEGTFVFTYTVSDTAGNTAKAERTVIVKDTVSPAISLIGDKTVYVGLNESFTDPGASANDAFDGEISERIFVSGKANTSEVGTYEIQYYIEDSNGNGAAVSRKVIVFRRPVILNVTYITQNGKYPNGCESVSAVMALRYAGIDISVDTFIDSYLNMDAKPTVGKTGPDIDVAYGGNPKSNDGWGCNSPVIVNAMNKFVDRDSYNISHSYGVSLDSLCKTYIDNGIPVVVWVTVNMVDSSASKYYVNWTTVDGKQITYNRRLHCMLLVGYDDDKYYFNDPKNTGNGTNYIGYSKSAANTAYGIMNCQSIAVYHK